MLDVGKWCIFHMVDDAILQVAKTVCVFGPSGNEAFILTKEDDVYALGANVNSCLAIPSGTSTLQPKKVEKLTKLNITSFSFGSAPHVLALTGKILMFITWLLTVHELLRKLIGRVALYISAHIRCVVKIASNK